MHKLELFRLIVAEIGDVSAAELSAHLEKKHGFKIPPVFIPIYKASLKDLERAAQFRQETARITTNDSSEAA